ncbi:F-box/LRR-repeat protein fbxl-1 [Medicago truncatula]|uniref:F-box/LRR-repeat protein fbxl-1 n=1 Tax=Medicago truncatula TaxID=3880 RepID=UPI0019680331|nr:F-box/LRR-repeat protein fbxl-1-like [Medicago truncatula]
MALKSINLSQCSLLTYASLDILADSLGSILKELYLDDCILIDANLILSGLKRLEQLEVLSLAGVPTVSDKFIESYIIARGHNIKELILKDFINLTDASMKVIAEHCPGLHALDLMNFCRELRKLKFCRNPFRWSLVGQQTALSLSNNAKNLHTLDLTGCRNLTDNEIGLIVDRCLSLRSLKLFGCSQVTDVFLKRHSNIEIQIFGLNLCPLLQHIKEPDSE